MRIEGDYTFTAPREAVWPMFLDANVLSRAMPGDTSLEQIRVAHYTGKMHLRLGPLQGAYQGIVTLHEIHAPDGYQLTLDGQGPEGKIQGSGQLCLEAVGPQTKLHYAGEVQAYGRIAAESPRLLRTSANALIRQCLEALDQQVQNQLAIHTTSLKPTPETSPHDLKQRLQSMTAPQNLQHLDLRQQVLMLLGGWLLAVTGGLFVLRGLYNWWIGHLARKVAARLAEE